MISENDPIRTRFDSLVESYEEVDKAYVNKTTLHEWRTRWLPAWAAYFYKAKDDNGNLIDAEGDVRRFWNGRTNDDGSAITIGLPTHIVDKAGKVVYVVPSTITPLDTKLVDEKNTDELPLNVLAREALHNPIPQLIQAELSKVIKHKFKDRSFNFTEGLRKSIMMDYIFVQEGYDSLLGLKYNKDGSWEVLTEEDKQTVSNESKGPQDDSGYELEFEDID